MAYVIVQAQSIISGKHVLGDVSSLTSEFEDGNHKCLCLALDNFFFFEGDY